MRIQIVDDSTVNCEIFATIAERLAPDVVVTSFLDPLQAYEACKLSLPDLILVDFMMPGMNGHEYVARVRRLPGAKTLPIIMVTAATERSIRHEALNLGVTDFLTKPIDKLEMRARLTNLIALRRAHISLQDRSRWLAEEVRKATEQILHQANHDGLTGLPNRVFFRDKLEQVLGQAKAGGGTVALLYMDLDGFKAVNDTLGHAGGDTLLQQVSANLRGVLKDGEIPARLGGDEFALIQIGAIQPSGAADLAERAAGAISSICQVDDLPTSVGVSVGIALFPQDATDGAELVQRADIALYRTKRDAKGSFRFFEPEMDAELRARRSLERDLRAAVVNGEIAVHYQPQADAKTGHVVGFEALVRWSHPERGMVPPSDFIPLAEECGLIRTIGEWVLRSACLQATSWPDHMRLAVNLSPVQMQPNLPQIVQDILDETGLAPGRLELEITEGVLIKDPASAIAVLKALKSKGVAIALDDFGTGYSSLSYLQKFPFDRVKIDRSFVSDLLRLPEAEAIIRAIVAMTRSLCMTSIAEGVETLQQLAALQEEKCQEVQGYLIGRAMPADEVPAFLENQSWLFEWPVGRNLGPHRPYPPALDGRPYSTALDSAAALAREVAG